MTWDHQNKGKEKRGPAEKTAGDLSEWIWIILPCKKEGKEKNLWKTLSWKNTGSGNAKRGRKAKEVRQGISSKMGAATKRREEGQKKSARFRIAQKRNLTDRQTDIQVRNEDQPRETPLRKASPPEGGSRSAERAELQKSPAEAKKNPSLFGERHGAKPRKEEKFRSHKRRKLRERAQ